MRSFKKVAEKVGVPILSCTLSFAVATSAVGLPLLSSGSPVTAPTFHLELEKSAPAADEQLEAAPKEIRLWFSEAAELAISQIVLEGPAGPIELDELKQSEDKKVLYAATKSTLAPATYKVSWRTSSGDGHPIRGEFSFSVMASGTLRSGSQ